MYGLNYYMGNIFHDFADNQPEKGYFLACEKNVEAIINKYGDKYTFTKLTSTENIPDEVDQKIILFNFIRK